MSEPSDAGDEELDEEKFATDLIGQIEAKVTRKLRKAGIKGVTVKVNQADYSLDLSGAPEEVQKAREFLAEEQRRVREG